MTLVRLSAQLLYFEALINLYCENRCCDRIPFIPVMIIVQNMIHRLYAYICPPLKEYLWRYKITHTISKLVDLVPILQQSDSQFYPRPVLAFGYCRCLRMCVCVCVCLSVNHQLVRAITHQPFKLESPNLDQRCKRHWLRSLLFFGTIDLELQGQIEPKNQDLPHFELVRAISHHQLKSVFPNLGQKCILALLRSLLIWGWIDLYVLFHF